MVPNLDIFFFCKIFQLDKFEGADFKYENSFLKILAPPKKKPDKAFLVPNLGISLFHEVLELNKFEGADFKYDNSSPKYLNLVFLVPN